MKKFDLSSAVSTAKHVITANSPVLLVGTAVAGVVATGVLAARGGYKARGIVDEERMRRVASPEPPFDTFQEYYDTYVQKADPLTVKEKAQLTWLCYAPAALTGASSIGATFGVHMIHTKRHAAMAGLYAAASMKLDDYKEEAEKLLTPKKTQELNDAVAQKVVDREGFENHEVIITNDGNELCYDEWSGRWFLSSMNKIEQAVVEINKKLNEEGEATLNDFYDKLGLKGIAMGVNYGWPGGTLLEARFGAVQTPDSRSAISFWFHNEPQEGCGVRR